MGNVKQTIKNKVYDWTGYDPNAPQSVTVADYFRDHKTDIRHAIKNYVLSLFPFLQWMPRYNLQWLYGDLIAGITVGMVLVPQSLSYAKLANLPAEYGLYSSFIGVLTYALFATAKDVSIGPVAVMSLETGRIIHHVQEAHPNKWSSPEIGVCLAFICGFIVLAIGLFRIGWIIEFIPQPAVSGFMTGSALSIAAGQVPAILGTSKLFDTKAATYQVIINTLKHLPDCTLDAAFGVSSLAMLYFIKWGLTFLQTRYPKYARWAFFAQALRHALVIILFTIISWRINYPLIKDGHKSRIALVGYVPSGLQHVGSPHISTELISAMSSHLPVATIILLLEHISIAKSFGRLNGYKINPNQELIAIGVNNTVGSVFSAYPSTGSFSRSALKSKSGVRTPAAGIPTGVVVIIALYAVAPAFYWIPNATLSALIVHAVADLVASPKQSLGFWRVSPLEYIIFVGAVVWSVFYTIESGIYWSLVCSVVLLLFRIARPKGHFLGRVRIRPENNKGETRDVYVPLCRNGVTNDDVTVEQPPAGIVIYRFEESFLYPNASYINDKLVMYVKQHTRRGKDYRTIKMGDRPWNDPGPKKGHEDPSLDDSHKPLCRAVILDFQAVANIDTTGVQNLIDARKEVEKWADRSVEFHFCGILSPWIRRALIAGGFGTDAHKKGVALEVAPIVRPYGVGGDADPAHTDLPDSPRQRDLESGQFESGLEPGPSSTPTSASGTSEFSDSDIKFAYNASTASATPRDSHDKQGSIVLLDRATPFFHFDLADSLNAIAVEDLAASKGSKIVHAIEGEELVREEAILEEETPKDMATVRQEAPVDPMPEHQTRYV